MYLQDIVGILECLAFRGSGDFTEPCTSFLTMSEAPRNSSDLETPLCHQ